MNGNSYQVDDIEAAWNTNKRYENGNNAYRPLKKAGYCAVAPNDTAHDIRSEMCLLMEEMGLVIEAQSSRSGNCRSKMKLRPSSTP